jgi:hypothetical protein
MFKDHQWITTIGRTSHTAFASRKTYGSQTTASVGEHQIGRQSFSDVAAFGEIFSSGQFGGGRSVRAPLLSAKEKEWHHRGGRSRRSRGRLQCFADSCISRELLPLPDLPNVAMCIMRDKALSPKGRRVTWSSITRSPSVRLRNFAPSPVKQSFNCCHELFEMFGHAEGEMSSAAAIYRQKAGGVATPDERGFLVYFR